MMRKHIGATPTRETGFSLVGLMVGLFLSMIGLLAGVMLYQNLVRVSVESQADANYDGRVASALLALQLELQSAGFGIPNAGAEHIAVATSGSDDHLYWRYQDSGYQCRGFESVDVSGVRVLRLTEASSCDASSGLTGLTWTPSDVLAEFRQDQPDVSFTLSTVSCFPYGQGEPGDHYMVQVDADSSLRTYANNSYSFCLPNLNW